MTPFFYKNTGYMATGYIAPHKRGGFKTAGRFISGGESLPPAPKATAAPTSLSDQAAEDNTLDGQHTDRLDLDACGERAAIAEFDGGIPRQWAEGLATLCTMPRPDDVGPRRWRAIVEAAGVFSDKWAARAHQLDWSVQEVFGCHAGAPTVRVDCMGLLLAMADPSVTLVELTRDMATFEVGRGRHRQTMRRDMVFSREQRLIFEEIRQ